MSQSAAVGFVVLLALLAANLPFASQRLFGLLALRRGKGLAWEALELLALYAAVGLVARLLEGRSGQAAPQGWEFYAVTAALFLVLAFPGFVWRHLVRRGRRA